MTETNPPRRRTGLAGFDAYTLVLNFYCGVLAVTRGRVQAEPIDQLTRAAESVIRNIGEAHPTVGPDRVRCFRIAANEASKCGASLDILEIRSEIDPQALADRRTILDRVRAILWRPSHSGSGSGCGSGSGSGGGLRFGPSRRRPKVDQEVPSTSMRMESALQAGQA